MSDTSTGGATETTLAASSTAGAPPQSHLDSSSTDNRQPGVTGSATASADATSIADSRRESTEDRAAADAATGTGESARDPDDLESDPELAAEIAEKPKLYDRFKEKNEAAKAAEARAEAAEAEARRLKEQWEQQADPVLARFTAIPEVKRYLDAGIPLKEAMELADADVSAARDEANRQRVVSDTQAEYERNIQAWDAYIKDAPDLETVLERQAEFLEALKPILHENAQAKPIVQEVQQNIAQLQAKATTDAILQRFKSADRDAVHTLVLRGDVRAAEAVAERQHKAMTEQEARIAAIKAEADQREAEAKKRAEAEAIARYNAEQTARSQTPTPVAGTNGAPGAPPTGLLSSMPTGDPNDPKFRAAFAKWMESQGQQTTDRRGW